MYRPDGWVNPYAKSGDTDENYDSLMFEIFEAGADAMLEALTVMEGVSIKISQDSIVFYPALLPSGDWIKGKFIFIPDDE